MKARRQIKERITAYLENDCAFRDYRILPRKFYRKVNRIGIHHMFCADVYKNADVEFEIDDALATFCRDGFPTIFFYI